MDDRVSIPDRARNFVSMPPRPDRLWAPPILHPMGTVGSFPAANRSGREDDSSPPCDTEVINAWSYISTSPYVLMAQYLIKHRDNFPFYLALKAPLYTVLSCIPYGY